MKQLHHISARAPSFAQYFVSTGGNAALSARKAGYSHPGSARIGVYLLRNPLVLDLVATEIKRRAPGWELALARLNRSKMPPEDKLRLQMMLATEAGSATAIRTLGRTVVVLDADDVAMREHAVRFGNLASPTASQILLNSFENGAVPRPIDECAADKELSEPEIGDQNVPDPFA
jgi:hypothetical protein